VVTSEAVTPGDEPGEHAWEGPLPEAVRLRVVALASDALGAMGDDEVPLALRKFRSWAPSRRTKLAATPLATAVDHDPIFRQRVATRLRESAPQLSSALEAGGPPAAADPVEVAAAAYLLHASGWPDLVAKAGAAAARASEIAETSQATSTIARLQESVAALRAEGRAELARARADVEAAQAETAAVRKELREERGARRRAERAVADAETRSAAAVDAAAAASAQAEEEVRRVRARLAEAEVEVEAARRASREGRTVGDARARLLLDTVVEAAAGLRRELALPPTSDRPADFVEGAAPGSSVTTQTEQGRPADDPAALDQLLALPQVHLIVDGYNVTKTGYPDLPLEAQRSRLVGALVALAARSAAEVTCCFDGATVEGRVPSMSGRGVRVLFSKPGEIADDLIRRLVRAEPPGRPVVVVSSDQEVADGVRRSGARAVSAAALVRRLDRG
jgi:predicted RNA-binding protein with PIN domain